MRLGLMLVGSICRSFLHLDRLACLIILTFFPCHFVSVVPTPVVAVVLFEAVKNVKKIPTSPFKYYIVRHYYLKCQQQEQKQQNKMQSHSSITAEKFTSIFQKFMAKHKCSTHNKTPTFICVHEQCENRGAICSNCLTVTGAHKNHDALDLADFYQLCLADPQVNCSRDSKKGSIAVDGDSSRGFVAMSEEQGEVWRQISDYYEGLLKVLAEFHENFSNIIKEYIEKKSKYHDLREKDLKQRNLPTNNNNQSHNNREQSMIAAFHKLQQCNFTSISQANKTLNKLTDHVVLKKITIIQQPSPSSLINHKNAEVIEDEVRREKEKVKDFLDDIKYEHSYIKRELKGFQAKLKQLLVIKGKSPVVLNHEPTFMQPTFIQDEKMVYMGEERAGMPHGKGICYLRDAQKIIYGSFDSGNVEDKAELYFLNGDYYIGEFRENKKEGRGVYRWNAQESNVYEGEFENGRRHGRGTFWWGDGSRYEGNFFKGQQTGFGSLFRQGKIKQYEGNWVNGMFSGYGIQYFQNGEKYEGYFKDDKFHGQGIFYKADKSVIKGVWSENELTSVKNM